VILGPSGVVLITPVFLTEGDADATVGMQSNGLLGSTLEADTDAATGREGDDGKGDSLEGGVLVGAGLEGGG
jgi:hypothetical protein